MLQRSPLPSQHRYPIALPVSQADVVVQLRRTQQIMLENSLVENNGPVCSFYELVGL
jgi:hypothetical protein